MEADDGVLRENAEVTASRHVDGVNGLSMHCLEAGTPGRPCVLLLHGFPECRASWRAQLPALAALGWRVVAPDLRGYGDSSRPTGKGDTPSRRRIFLCTPANAADELPCARRIVANLATFGYRRPIAEGDAEVNTLMKFYAAGRGQGG